MTTLRVTGGRVLRPDLTIAPGDVLLDQEAGTILEVTEPGGGTGEATLDATGGLVIPGLVNAHTHLAMTLLRGYADDKPLDRWLREDVWPIEAALTPADIRAGAELALVELIRSGTTAVCDMYFSMAEVAAAVEAGGLRGLLGRGVITVDKDEGAAREDAEAGLQFAEAYDGAADGRIRTAFMPHSLVTVGEAYLEAYVPRARDLGVPVHLHASETGRDAASIVEAHGLRPVAYARERGLLTPGDFLAHGVHLDDGEIDLLAETGAGVVHCPAANAKLASGMAPVQRLLEAGVPVGLGTDGAASNNDLDLFGEMRDAAMIGKLATGEASALDAETVATMATAGGASLLGVDAGRIEPGAAADLAVVDLEAPHLTPAHDLVSHLVYAARGSDVRHTVCDGRVVMRDRTVLTLDEEAVLSRARSRARELVDRAE